jgi:hypothetical protein
MIIKHITYMADMSTTTEHPAQEKQKPLPAVKLALDLHQAIGLRKLRGGGNLQDQVDAALRVVFAEELAQLGRE